MRYINPDLKKTQNRFEEASELKRKKQQTLKLKQEQEEKKSEPQPPQKKPENPLDPMVVNTDRGKLMQMYKEGLLIVDELRGILTDDNKNNMYQ